MPRLIIHEWRDDKAPDVWRGPVAVQVDETIIDQADLTILAPSSGGGGVVGYEVTLKFWVCSIETAAAYPPDPVPA